MGPAIAQSADPGPANQTLMVAFCAATNTLVVAVAGTNPLSTFDVEDEDLAVSTTVAFGTGSAQMSQGNSVGLNLLLGLTDPTTGDSLATYLTNVAASGTTLVFAGHSLGGALAPALALALFTPRGALAGTTWASVGVAASAGPGVGDAAYATQFAATFPVQDSGLNAMTWNSLDVVPQAWASSSFSVAAIQGLYPKIPVSPDITTLLTRAVALPPTPNPYVQLANNGSFTGTYQDHLDPITDLGKFVAEVLYQHIMGYYEQLTPDLIDVLKPFNPYEHPVEMGVIDAKVKAWAEGS